MELDLPGYTRWLAQAKDTVSSAGNDIQGGFFNWACFKAQQAAEYAIKGLIGAMGEPALGHSLLRLCETLNELDIDASEIEDFARKLDRYYIPTRYPDAYPEGSPGQYYTKEDAKRAVSHSKKIIRFVEDKKNELGKC